METASVALQVTADAHASGRAGPARNAKAGSASKCQERVCRAGRGGAEKQPASLRNPSPANSGLRKARPTKAGTLGL